MFWAVAGAAMGAYDGYQYAKKKNLKGLKKGAAIVGGALIGAVNPFKIVGKVGKVAKAVKTAKKAKKTTKALKSVTKTPKKTVVTKKVTKVATAGNKTVKTTGIVKAQSKTVKGACFVAGTKVSTDKGFMPIEKIKPGDYVWSENPETNEKALKKVNKIFVREKDSIVRLSINGEIIETTDEHPFYVEGKGFVGAGALNYGDEVRLQNGDAATVDDIDIVQLNEPIKVYNFEVEDFHTYYVSEQEVLVHNTCAANPNGFAKVNSFDKVSWSISTNKTMPTTAIVPYYPANDGAVVGSKVRTYLMPGERIDRFGSPKGKYFAPTGTPMEARALPYDGVVAFKCSR